MHRPGNEKESSNYVVLNIADTPWKQGHVLTSESSARLRAGVLWRRTLSLRSDPSFLMTAIWRRVGRRSHSVEMIVAKRIGQRKLYAREKFPTATSGMLR